MPLLLLPSSSGGAATTYTDLASLTTQSSVALLLTVDGCPYYFCTPGTSGVSWTGARDPDWCGAGDAVQWYALPLLDVAQGLAWTETVEVLDGATRVSGLTFRLQSYSTLDALIATAETIGDDSTALAGSSLTAASSTITVADGTPFGSSDFTVWIDREAIRCSSRTGTTLTVAASGRAALGSRAAAHNLDVEDGYAPEVFAAFPGFARRRVVLWAAALSGGTHVDPVPLWRGLVTSAPRLSADGTAWELPCEHVVTALDDVRIGVPSPGVRVQGYYANAARYALIATFQANLTVGGWTSAVAVLARGEVYRSATAVAQALSAQFTEKLAAAAITGVVAVTVEADGLVFRVANLSGADGANLAVWAWAGRETATWQWDGTAPLDPARTLTVPLPPAFVECVRDGASTLPVASAAELPATGWGSYDASDGPGLTVRAAQCLVGAPRDGLRLVVTPTTDDAAADNVVDVADRTVRGVVRVYDATGARAPTAIPGVFELEGRGFYGGRPVEYLGGFIVAPVTFALSLMVEASSWPYALRAALVEDEVLAGSNASIDCDPDDWSWDRVEALRTALPETLAPRSWVFDGTQTLGDLLGEELKLAGGLLALRRSRLAPAPIEVPLRSGDYDLAHTIELREEVSGRPTWAQSPDGIVNAADVTLGGGDGASTMRLLVTDRRSVAKYGKRNTLEVEARGIAVSDATLATGPDALLRTLLARVLGLWSEPIEYVTLAVAWNFADTIYLGDRVRFVDWSLPNGRGSRGHATTYRAGLVVGRGVTLGPSPCVTLTLAVWGGYAQAAGWSPCCRISAISSATLTVATGYVLGGPSDGPTDYAGSNRSGYAGQGSGPTVANDGGTGWFAAGDRVRLVRRDVTSATTASAIISTVTPATNTIVLQAAPGGSWPTWASTGIVDLTYDEYATSGLQTGQEAFAWIGDRATRVVDGTTDPLTRWAP